MKIFNKYHTPYGDVGAATGLTDINGRQLYIGDVVSIQMQGEAKGRQSLIVADKDESFVMGLRTTSSYKLTNEYKLTFVQSCTLLTPGRIKIGHDVWTIGDDVSIKSDGLQVFPGIERLKLDIIKEIADTNDMENLLKIKELL
ncbi:hypothetical protein Acj133p023 [Acinetobacter phage 133]|uniref:Uncharacterized protein n=1 Tax=Acinetobacter phage 133 TaxID=2919552 RepID=D9I5Y9_9CAUD|nr:hypothetical protein Acj133p023 [Acinetobacter phage 133]ADJ19370.1 hypothetical protein Acj133p023 [Acinetobacter phage 133]